jgi:tetratricopeptide (TPR) repeat protein
MSGCSYPHSTYFCSMRARWLATALLFVAAACNDTATKETKADTVATAEELLKKSIAQFPDSLSLRDSLITYYANGQNYEAALATTDAVLKKDSTIAYFWDIKAKLHGMVDDTAQAIRALERASDLNPLPEYLMSLGYLYADTKNEKALAIGDALIVANKAAAQKEALLIKGIYYSKTGNKQKALALFSEALQLDYTFMLAYREKAMALYDLGQYKEAIALLEKATKLRNNFDEGYYWLGKCNEKLGKLNEAADYYQMALYYSPDFIEAKDALGRLGVK